MLAITAGDQAPVQTLLSPGMPHRATREAARLPTYAVFPDRLWIPHWTKRIPVKFAVARPGLVLSVSYTHLMKNQTHWKAPQ